VLLPQLAEWLCANQASDARAARLITRTHIFLMPTMNPDGFALHRRANA
jgi:carboxypeptidase D